MFSPRRVTRVTLALMAALVFHTTAPTNAATFPVSTTDDVDD